MAEPPEVHSGAGANVGVNRSHAVGNQGDVRVRRSAAREVREEDRFGVVEEDGNEADRDHRVFVE